LLRPFKKLFTAFHFLPRFGPFSRYTRHVRRRLHSLTAVTATPLSHRIRSITRRNLHLLAMYQTLPSDQVAMQLHPLRVLSPTFLFQHQLQASSTHFHATPAQAHSLNATIPAPLRHRTRVVTTIAQQHVNPSGLAPGTGGDCEAGKRTGLRRRMHGAWQEVT
jgi:hypothetical protein